MRYLLKLSNHWMGIRQSSFSMKIAKNTKERFEN